VSALTAILASLAALAAAVLGWLVRGELVRRAQDRAEDRLADCYRGASKRAQGEIDAINSAHPGDAGARERLLAKARLVLGDDWSGDAAGRGTDQD
jgi:hypothetical protein